MIPHRHPRYFENVENKVSKKRKEVGNHVTKGGLGLDSEAAGGHGLDSESGGSQVLDSEPRGGQKLTVDSG